MPTGVSLIFFILSIIALTCEGLYFYISETEKKCFSEDLADDTIVVGKYKVEIYDKIQNRYIPTIPGLGMHVEVLDPEDRPIMSRTYSTEGKFSFNSHSPGEHIICLHSNSTAWFGGAKLKVFLSISVGEAATDYKEVAKKEKLNELQLRVLQLVEKVEQISKEQSYQRVREERFRQTSESTSQQVLWWAIGQTALLIIASLWQLKHLKGFFEAKKLV
ncbi:hypothetical protein HELRODRAFT_109739 [Helobdella robusta]|uniref:GOLD domain-containing protein n=1 Tax=Helobdella robusta TaxID=6412 RepID=T1EEW2_HELRO|nr:hypothetical protein HELRODRAFT_109739 [Helobdella robusta]ESO09551.1 hypothetical protein HELRODRAFT_109739 [Helobdella robusta]